MAAGISALFRHPVKGLGVEALPRVRLFAGRTMPGDREWALAQEGAPIDRTRPQWVRCTAFIRGAKAPALMAVGAARAHDGRMILSHPALDDLVFDPATDEGAAALIRWLHPIYPRNRPAPSFLVHLPDRGMTDSSTQTVTLLSDASLAALSKSVGKPLDRRRFRGNVWAAGLAPWQELDLIGREIMLGALRGRVTKPVGRCRAPNGNPETGREDCDVLGHLNAAFGHPHFGVFVEITEGGTLSVGDDVRTGAAA